MGIDKALVSVVVVTYNSARTILSTLDSIYNQTYKDLELIISDDSSTDETVSVCKDWLVRNGSRFINFELMEVSHNSGVSINLNRGINKANGEWIKPIAGDDLLPVRAIENYIRFVKKKKIKTICNASSVEFIERNHEKKIVGLRPEPYIGMLYSQNAKRQLAALVGENICFLGCTSFVSKDFIISMGGYDESFPQVEDWPFFIKATSMGYNIDFSYEFVGCLHRVGENTLSNTIDGFFNIKAYGKSGVLDQLQEKFFKPYVNGLLYRWNLFIDRKRRYFIIYGMKNRNNLKAHFVSKLFLLFSPLAIRRKVYNFLHKRVDYTTLYINAYLTKLEGDHSCK